MFVVDYPCELRVGRRVIKVRGGMMAICAKCWQTALKKNETPVTQPNKKVTKKKEEAWDTGLRLSGLGSSAT